MLDHIFYCIFFFGMCLLKMCSAYSCNANEFRCGDGLCIKKHYLCDGIKHCPSDGSDELNCVDNEIGTGNKIIGKHIFIFIYHICICINIQHVHMLHIQIHTYTYTRVKCGRKIQTARKLKRINRILNLYIYQIVNLMGKKWKTFICKFI